MLVTSAVRYTGHRCERIVLWEGPPLRHLQSVDSLPSGLALFEGVDPCDREQVLDCLGASYVTYDEGDVVAEAARTAGPVAYLTEGRVYGCVYDEEGNRSILHVFVPGQALSYGGAFGFNTLVDMTAVARCGCRLLVFDLAVPSSPHLRRCVDIIRANLAQTVAAFGADLAATLGIRSRRTARGKVLAYLEHEARRQGSSSVVVPLTRQELADYLSIDRATLSRELRTLADEGHFEVDRNHFDLHLKPKDGRHASK